MRYYVCAYGHVVRWSDKCSSPEQAAQECFGVVERVTVLDAGTRVDKVRQYNFRVEMIKQIRELHRSLTGNEIEARS